MRTSKYKVINVNPIFEGQKVLEDVITGLHKFKDENSTSGINYIPNPDVSGFSNYRDVTSRTNKKIIGYLGYYKTKDGFEKSVWMSIDDIHEHASKYSKSYSEPYGAWKDPKKRPVMEMKTVLIALLKWADLSGVTGDTVVTSMIENVENFENDDEVIEGSYSETDEKLSETNAFIEKEEKAETLMVELKELLKSLGGSKNEKVVEIVTKNNNGSKQVSNIEDVEVLKKILKELKKQKNINDLTGEK
jgi:recombination protein RecT